jgi:hypothetical protein
MIIIYHLFIVKVIILLTLRIHHIILDIRVKRKKKIIEDKEDLVAIGIRILVQDHQVGTQILLIGIVIGKIKI